jgi:hypothetical protein
MPKPSSELPSSVLDENGNLRVLFRHGFKIVEFNDQHYAEAMTEEELETVAARNGHSDLCAGCYMSNGWCETTAVMEIAVAFTTPNIGTASANRAARRGGILA